MRSEAEILEVIGYCELAASLAERDEVGILMEGTADALRFALGEAGTSIERHVLTLREKIKSALDAVVRAQRQ